MNTFKEGDIVTINKLGIGYFNDTVPREFIDGYKNVKVTYDYLLDKLVIYNKNGINYFSENEYFFNLFDRVGFTDADFEYI